MTAGDAVIADEQFRHVVSLCRSWLRFQTPSALRFKQDGIAVRAQNYDPLFSGKSGLPGFGPYLPVLREAQYHWAALMLESPMMREAAFLRRTTREAYKIAHALYSQHRKEWTAWESMHPIQSVNSLMEAIAEEMALKLGPSIL